MAPSVSSTSDTTWGKFVSFFSRGHETRGTGADMRGWWRALYPWAAWRLERACQDSRQRKAEQTSKIILKMVTKKMVTKKWSQKKGSQKKWSQKNGHKKMVTKKMVTKKMVTKKWSKKWSQKNSLPPLLGTLRSTTRQLDDAAFKTK